MVLKVQGLEFGFQGLGFHGLGFAMSGPGMVRRSEGESRWRWFNALPKSGHVGPYTLDCERRWPHSGLRRFFKTVHLNDHP
jgi:hypothetical protein